MKIRLASIVLGILILSLPGQMRAQTNAPVAGTNAVVHVNTAIVPVKHTGPRTETVMQRAQAAPGDYDIAFIGDSITEGWETRGKNIWQKYYGSRKCINLGVGGDRTEHVLWRFENGQIDGLKPKVCVVMIGTNNGNNESEILEGVTAIIRQIQSRLPETKIILLGIFPRGKTFSVQRGKLLQVNQALEKLADGKNIFWTDIGSQLIEADGSISVDMMRDALHPGETGYEIWGAAIEPKLKELLGK
jgi:lysophospholipase L1-like esterase